MAYAIERATASGDMANCSREKVERAHALYPMNCPLFRTLHNAIRLTSSVELVRASAP
jgi:uncharacterized OsmC-like protein